MEKYQIPVLPLSKEVETKKVLKKVADLEDNLLSKMKIGREFYFINNGLMALFSEFDYKL